MPPSHRLLKSSYRHREGRSHSFIESRARRISPILLNRVLRPQGQNHPMLASSSFSGKAWFTRCLTCMKSQSSFSRSIRRGAIRKTSSLSIPKTGRQKASSKVSDAPDHRMRRSRGRFMPSEEFTLQSAFIWRMSGKKSFTTATCQLHKGVVILRYVFRLMYLNMSSGGLKQCSRTHSSTYAGSCSSADP
jgi:hypothetical protein